MQVEQIAAVSGYTPGSYAAFLEVANRAAREADDDQRRLIRALGCTNPTPEVARDGIEKIMGW